MTSHKLLTDAFEIFTVNTDMEAIKMQVVTVSTAASVNIGDLAYIEVTQIKGNTVDVRLRDTPSTTRNGIEKEAGLLYSRTDTSGTTFDYIALGLHRVVGIKLLRTIQQDYDPYTNEVTDLIGEAYAYEVTFCPVSAVARDSDA
jgi:hypothetical protein